MVGFDHLICAKSKKANCLMVKVAEFYGKKPGREVSVRLATEVPLDL